jgi:ABC-type glycerol-3-phosphate transport system substrate-binding protein
LPFITRGVWAIPKGSRAKGRAADFMTFISNDQNQLAFAKIAPSGVVVPTVSKAYTDAYISSTGEPLAQARNIIANALPNTRVPEKTLPYPISNDIRTKLITALNEAQRKMWNGTQPGQALFEADKIWNDLLKQ